MTEVHKGEVVRVVGSSSEWQGSHGMVIEVIDRKHGDGNDKVQECAIEFGGERRWFMVEHLVKVVPTNKVRFFRAEAIERWHLDTDRANYLDGRRDQLINLLQNVWGFSKRRASAETDEFFRALDEKIRCATQVLTR
jgi:hypothetical protein